MPQEHNNLHQSEFLLERSKEDESFEEPQNLYTDYTRHRWYTAWNLNLIVIFVLLASLVQNAVLFQRNKSLVHKLGMGISKYSKLFIQILIYFLTNVAGLPTNIPTVYKVQTNYVGENETLADELWDNINLDGTVVALSPEYVKEHKLEKSSPFPWDTEREVYFLKVFHSLHCLVSSSKTI